MLHDILHMGWPLACVLIAAIIGGVVIYIGKKCADDEKRRVE